MKKANYYRAGIYLFDRTCEESTSGNLYIPIEEVEEYVGEKMTKEDFINICNIVREDYEDKVLDVNENDDDYAWSLGEFNMNIGTEYLSNWEEEDDDNEDEEEE
jgi:hypothetical protein